MQWPSWDFTKCSVTAVKFTLPSKFYIGEGLGESETWVAMAKSVGFYSSSTPIPYSSCGSSSNANRRPPNFLKLRASYSDYPLASKIIVKSKFFHLSQHIFHFLQFNLFFNVILFKFAFLWNNICHFLVSFD